MKILGLELDKSFRNGWIISSIIVFIGSFFLYLYHSSNINLAEWFVWSLPVSFGGVLFFALIIGISTTRGEE